jgi:hypothetical protein
VPLPIPPINLSLFLRADFTDDDAWISLCDLAQGPTVDGFEAGLFCVSDREYDGLSAAALARMAADESELTFAFLADAVTINDEEHPIVVVDLWDEPGRTFRVIPAEMASVQNNLEIANMDFDEFAAAVGEDGVFRGFG